MHHHSAKLHIHNSQLFSSPSLSWLCPQGQHPNGAQHLAQQVYLLRVTSHCDGAFVLAKAGLLDNVESTTFPSDVEAYRKMFPQLSVKENVLFVHDEKYITSAGGAKSFEASLYLCEVLYGKEIAKRLAKGLVIDWDVDKLDKHIVK